MKNTLRDMTMGLLQRWEGSSPYKLLETDLNKKTRFTKIFQFIFPALLFILFLVLTVSMLYFQKGWDVAKELLSGWIFYLLPPLGKEIIIPTRVASGVPASYIGFATFWVDLCVCLFLTWNYDWVKRIPWVGKAMLRTEQKGRDRVKSSRWFRRAVFLMVTSVVFIPLQGSGGVGGTLLGRVVGLHPYLVVLSVGLGSLLGSYAYGAFSEAMVGVMEESTVFIFISEVNILQILAVGIAVGLLIYVIRNPRKATEDTGRLLSNALDAAGKGILLIGDSGEEATHLTFRGVRDTLTLLDKVGDRVDDVNLELITMPIGLMGPSGREMALNAKVLGKKRLRYAKDLTGKFIGVGLNLSERAASITMRKAGEIGKGGMDFAKIGVGNATNVLITSADRLGAKKKDPDAEGGEREE